jgi:hypothetical protein
MISLRETHYRKEEKRAPRGVKNRVIEVVKWMARIDRVGARSSAGAGRNGAGQCSAAGAQWARATASSSAAAIVTSEPVAAPSAPDWVVAPWLTAASFWVLCVNW